MNADEMAGIVLAGGYAALLYLHKMTTEIAPGAQFRHGEHWRADCATRTIWLRDDLAHDEVVIALRGAIKALLGGHTVVIHDDGTIGLSPRAAVGYDGYPTELAPTPPVERPRLRLV